MLIDDLIKTTEDVRLMLRSDSYQKKWLIQIIRVFMEERLDQKLARHGIFKINYIKIFKLILTDVNSTLSKILKYMFDQSNIKIPNAGYINVSTILMFLYYIPKVLKICPEIKYKQKFGKYYMFGLGKINKSVKKLVDNIFIKSKIQQDILIDSSDFQNIYEEIILFITKVESTNQEKLKKICVLLRHQIIPLRVNQSLVRKLSMSKKIKKVIKTTSMT